jgi:hypothetical protein
MKKVFADSEEKYLMGVVVYAKAADSILYADLNTTTSTYSNPLEKADLIDLFNKGLLIVDTGSGFVRPTTLAVSTNYATVAHTTVGASDKAVSTVYGSKNYVAG